MAAMMTTTTTYRELADLTAYTDDASSVLDAETVEALRACAAGSYQRNLLSGVENWSGSSLKGAASNWGSKYRSSRESLLARLQAVGQAHGLDIASELIPVGRGGARQRHIVIRRAH